MSLATEKGPPPPPRLRVAKGSPWIIDAGRRAKWSHPDFVAKNAVEVRQIGDPVLHGVGIAAPQIGVALKVAIMDVDEAGVVAIEPEIEWTSDEVEETSEGCLSVRGMYGMIERPLAARLIAVDINGKRFVAEGEEFGAQCMIHETEHLAGTLYVDRLRSRADLHTVESDEEDRERETA